MNNSLIVANSITINASTSKVWDALINPEQTKKYMYGCEALSDWKIGSSLLWKGSHEGKEMIFVKGNIVDIQPENFLVYTVIDPHGPYKDAPENYLTVTYSLSSKDGQTTLTVTQGDYAKVERGEERYNHTLGEGGWESILVQVKKLVESN